MITGRIIRPIIKAFGQRDRRLLKLSTLCLQQWHLLLFSMEMMCSFGGMVQATLFLNSFRLPGTLSEKGFRKFFGQVWFGLKKRYKDVRLSHMDGNHVQTPYKGPISFLGYVSPTALCVLRLWSWIPRPPILPLSIFYCGLGSLLQKVQSSESQISSISCWSLVSATSCCFYWSAGSVKSADAEHCLMCLEGAELPDICRYVSLCSRCGWAGRPSPRGSPHLHPIFV